MDSKHTPTGRFRSGKAGGTQTLRRHGREHYRRIGAMGGKARKHFPKPA